MTPKIPNPAMLDLARRLLDYESARTGPQEGASAVFQVGEKLRRPLSGLAGTAGFRSLVARALTLAKANVPALSGVQINPDGSLDGFSALGDRGQAAEAAVMLIAQLLALLVVFIGEGLVLNLVLDVWPDLPVSEHRTLEKK
ncbi:MAG TPA: hypothetical protein VMZ52_15410 [Bryobacteraceae bacterium]|nr:hypothetical protein [Bryobacteraceae bacterium]